MFRNAYYDRKNSTMHLWETVNGKRVHVKELWAPFVFTEGSLVETETKSIFGHNVIKREFPTYDGYRDFIENGARLSTQYIQKLNHRLAELASKSSDENKTKLKQRLQRKKEAGIPFSKDDRQLINEITFLYPELLKRKNRLNPKAEVKAVQRDTEVVDKVEYFENDVKPEIQFLVDRYYHIPDDEFEAPVLNIHTMDIEVHSEKGFPVANLAEWPVTLIGCHDTGLNELHVFGCKEYTGENLKEPWFHYHYCPDEKVLLKSYLTFVNTTQPDVITGWNVIRFDIEYLINRIKRLFGNEADEIISLLSPIGVVSTWDNKGHFNVDIAGVSIIDYLPLYKDYTKTLLGINLESYSLDFVSNFELEKGKLDFSEYANLKELFKKNFNKYTDYNVIDVKRVKQINEKRNFINILLILSLYSKCPMKYCDAVTSIIEGAFLTYYRRNDLCAPRFRDGQTKEPYEAAFVKEPYLGLHKYISDLDITSSYPHAMICCNMGNETYFGTIKGFRNGSAIENAMSESAVIEQVRKREFRDFSYQDHLHRFQEMNGDELKKFNQELKAGKYAIAPNGSIFRTDIRGSIAEVERYTFEQRKSTKKKQSKVGEELNKLRTKFEKDPTNKELEKELEEKQALFERLKALQIAYKRVINSAYGALAVPYFRSFNHYIAEAICAVGRLAVKNGNIFVNEVMRDITLSKDLFETLKELREKSETELTVKSSENEDFVIYIDTDSLFLNIGTFIEFNGLTAVWEALEEDERVIYAKRIAAAVMDYVNIQSYERTQIQDLNSQEHNYKISFKFEMIAKSGLWVAKKKYVLNIIDNEGVRPADPIKATGLEIVRSDTPSAVKDRIKEIMRDLLNDATLEQISAKVKTFEEELRSVAPEEIANNIGCKEINEYIETDLLDKASMSKERKKELFYEDTIVVDGKNRVVEMINYDKLLPEEKMTYRKGTPRHIKSVFNYNFFRYHENLLDTYEDLNPGEKARIVYVKPNKYRFETMAFLRWLPDFEEHGIEIDLTKMIEKNLIDKVNMLLKPMKLSLKDIEQSEAFDLFF